MKDLKGQWAGHQEIKFSVFKARW